MCKTRINQLKRLRQKIDAGVSLKQRGNPRVIDAATAKFRVEDLKRHYLCLADRDCLTVSDTSGDIHHLLGLLATFELEQAGEIVEIPDHPTKMEPSWRVYIRRTPKRNEIHELTGYDL
jgi:hypothetical protein